MTDIEPSDLLESRVVSRLLEGGYDPTTLATTLGVPIDDVIALLPPERQKIAAADAQLQLAMRQLAWRTIEEAMRILDEGAIPLKLKLIQKLSGDLARAIAVSDKDDLEDLRSDFATLMAEMRGAPRPNSSPTGS